MKMFKNLTTTTSALKMLYALSCMMFCYAFLRLILVLPLGETVRTYYTINYDKGEYTQIEGFDTPIINPVQLSNYVETVIGDIYNYNALNYYSHFNDVVSKYFKKESLALFFKSVEPRLNTVAKDGVAVSSAPLAAVQINDYGYIGNAFIFNVSMPIKITYSSKQGNYFEDTLVKLSLLRVPTSEHLTGLQILSLKEEPFEVRTIYELPELK